MPDSIATRLAHRRTTSPLWLPALSLVTGVICISFTGIFTKWAAMPGPVTGAIRMLVAAIVLALPFAREARTWTPRDRQGIKWGIACGLWFAINLGMLTSALLLTSAANATLLDNTAPIWVGLGALFVFKERLGRPYWLGLALALAGAAVVTGFNPLAGMRLGAGDALAFVGAIFYAGYLLTAQRARRDLRSFSFSWLVAVTAALTLFATSLLMGLPFTGYPITSYASVIAMGILSQAGGWLLIGYALGHLPASTAVIGLLAQPVVTGLLAIPLLGESLTLQQVIGGALALTGIYLCLRSKDAAAATASAEAIT